MKEIRDAPLANIGAHRSSAIRVGHADVRAHPHEVQSPGHAFPLPATAAVVTVRVPHVPGTQAFQMHASILDSACEEAQMAEQMRNTWL
jgi:3,4-dihydroxy-2-butanone 4-phosphate synthase